MLALLALADPEAELMPEYFAPGWQPFPTMTTTPAQAQMSVTYERVKRERAA